MGTEQQQEAQTSEWQETLERAGAVGSHLLGIQFDLNAAWRKTPEAMLAASFCDHNCTTEHGNYNCLAAATLNTGIQPKSLAPADAIIGAIATIADGAASAQEAFFAEDFASYCVSYNVPADVANAMRAACGAPLPEVNLFGGNPELHPQVTTIIAALRQRGHAVHLTTTGGRFMRDQQFLREIVANPPSLIALSADDFENADDIRHLAALPFDELKAAWKRVPREHGQRRKAIESVYAAKLAQSTDGFPPILFNMVLHNGNVDQAREMIYALHTAFPGVRVNPFPAQSAYYYDGQPALAPEYAGALCDFIDGMIETHLNVIGHEQDMPYVPRLHYWLMLRAVFDWAGDDHGAAMSMIAGNGIWQCYRSAPAGFYLQAGLGPEGTAKNAATSLPGGHLGCFWNRQTVTEPVPIWSESVSQSTAEGYIRAGKTTLAVQSTKPCPGCAFPRLTSNIISTESGMDRRLLPYYLARRKACLGY